MSKVVLREYVKTGIKVILFSFLICIICCRNASCAGEDGFFRKEGKIFYMVPDQRFQSGNVIGELNCPAFAWNREKEPVYGRVHWYDALSRIEFEPDMELCGGEGDEWNLIWVFEPDPKQGEYETVEGIVRVTIVLEEVPQTTLGGEFLNEMWITYFSKDIEPHDEQLEEIEIENDLLTEEIVSEATNKEQKNDTKIESVSGITTGPDKVTTIVGYEGTLLNGLGSSITGVGALGPEYEDHGFNYNDGNDYENDSAMEGQGAKDYTNREDTNYPEMITYSGELLRSSADSYESGGNSDDLSESGEKREIPQTGDQEEIVMWFYLLGASFFAIVMNLQFWKNRKKEAIR